MAGTLSSLGLGSSGALTADTIEKLKANDEKLQISPIQNKLSLVSQQNKAYDLITSLISSLAASTGSLGSDLLYLDRSTSISGDSVSVSASSGISPQSFTLDVTDLATKEIQESDQFTSTTAAVASGPGTLTFNVGAASFDIDVTASTSLEELSQMINDQSDGTLKAQVMNVAEGDYRLVLTSGDTGADQTISVTNTSGVLLQNLTQPVPIQAGSDAHFKYNGIDFTRSSNTIDDIISGLKITLDNTGSSTVTISQDSTKIADEMSGFVSAFNTLFQEIDNILTSDPEQGTVGVFNGDNTFKSLAREIKGILFGTDGNNNSLAGFFSTTSPDGTVKSAFSLNESGVLSFDKSVFVEKFNADPAAAEDFLKYSTDGNGNQVDGLFQRLDTFLDSQVGYNGALTRFGDNLNEQITRLEDEAIRTQELIDSRYEMMFQRFAAYDRIIGGLERQFSALSLQIEAAIAAKK